MAVEYRTINPRRMGLRPKIVDPMAVEFYRKHPHRQYDTGSARGGNRQSEMPSLDRKRDGRLVVMQGNHRIAAAIAEGRTIKVEIRSADAPKSEQNRPRGLLGWLCS